MLYACVSHACAPLALLAGVHPRDGYSQGYSQGTRLHCYRRSSARRVLTGYYSQGYSLALLAHRSSSARSTTRRLCNRSSATCPASTRRTRRCLRGSRSFACGCVNQTATRPPVLVDPSYDPARSGGRVEYAELQRAHARACTRMHMHHAQARTCSHARARSRNTLAHATRASIEADRAVTQSTVRHRFGPMQPRWRARPSRPVCLASLRTPSAVAPPAMARAA